MYKKNAVLDFIISISHPKPVDNKQTRYRKFDEHLTVDGVWSVGHHLNSRKKELIPCCIIRDQRGSCLQNWMKKSQGPKFALVLLFIRYFQHFNIWIISIAKRALTFGSCLWAILADRIWFVQLALSGAVGSTNLYMYMADRRTKTTS